jgi:MSHA pilin protein MshD
MSLVELVVTIVILGIALGAVTVSVAANIGRASDILLQTQAIGLAQSYLEEITSKRFDEASPPSGVPPCYAGGTPCTASMALGPEPGEARATYDDVDDYHGLHEGYGSPGAAPLVDIDGLTRADYQNFGVQVEVRYLDPIDLEAVLGVAELDAKLITLTLSHSGTSDTWRFGVYKSNY